MARTWNASARNVRAADGSLAGRESMEGRNMTGGNASHVAPCPARSTVPRTARSAVRGEAVKSLRGPARGGTVQMWTTAAAGMSAASGAC